MKTPLTQLYLVASSLGENVHSIILNLRNYNGVLEVHDNTFEDNTFKYSNCGVFSDWSQSFEQDNINSYERMDASHSRDIFQTKMLIFISGNTQPVSIAGNTFNRNSATMGILQFKLPAAVSIQPFLCIYNNTFENNSAYIGSNVITIEKLKSESLQESATCAGIYIGSNTFTHNVGCIRYSTGLLETTCINQTEKTML